MGPGYGERNKAENYENLFSNFNKKSLSELQCQTFCVLYGLLADLECFH